MTVLRTPGDREIVTERVFDASPQRVWDAWTKPELIARWWGLRDTATRVDALELRPGGAWRFVETGSGGAEYAFRGVYREIVPPTRLAFTFEWEGEPGHVLVDTLDFQDLGDGRTKLVVHALFHTREERDGMIDAGMEGGLNEGYEQLDALLAG